MNNSLIKAGRGRKVLFAAVPADGHFNPLIGLARHLAEAGYDVRWYAASKYEKKVQQLQIPFYRFRKEIDVTDNLELLENPERKKIHGAINKLKFDLENFFIRRGPVYYEDIREIYKTFPFDLFVADIAFTGSIFVKQLLKIPVISISVLPLIESSKDLAPTGLGLEPGSGIPGKFRNAFLRFTVNKILFNGPNKTAQRIMEEYGVDHQHIFIFDMIIRNSDYVLQSGSPGFEYKRSDLGKNIRFIGPLLDNNSAENREAWFDDRLLKYEIIILVTQGTIEKDVNKIIVPTLEALKNTGALIICTTGGQQTTELRKKYRQCNIIIEDFIPFNDVMPYAHLYVTNGGYGGVMLALDNKVPMVVAGIHEGKNEICSRIGFFKYGIDLKTEKPAPKQILNAVREVLANPVYKQNVEMINREFSSYNANLLFEKHVAELIHIRNEAGCDTKFYNPSRNTISMEKTDTKVA
jgi:MGT family glycosyltransferase